MTGGTVRLMDEADLRVQVGALVWWRSERYEVLGGLDRVEQNFIVNVVFD